jgi:two-component system phosphate regulon sensor histidine kinase PhoR
VKRPSSAAILKQSGPLTEEGMHQTNILVIDDEQIMRDGCSRILSKDGWSVICAENGNQGLEEIKGHSENIDVILLDLMMPGMSGMEVLDHIRTMDPNLLVIVITGYATVESAVEAMKKGAYDFIPKPFTPDQLRIVVRRALERRTLQKEAEFLRKEREKSLRDIATEKSKIKTIINCMGDGVLVCDRDGCIVLSNPAASRMLKAPETYLLGNYLNQCNLPQELSHTIEESLQVKDMSYTSVSQELGAGESGEIFLRAHTAPVRNDIGEIMGSVTVLQDISHLKELDKMKSEFIAMVTHELRAPIAAVEQQLNVILNKMAGEVTEKQEQLLSRAKKRTRGLLDLIRDLLDLSKIEAGKMVQYKEPLLLQEVIQRVVDLMRAEAENKKIDLQFSAPSNISLIHADRNSMEGIFTNLISNAIKYTPEGRKVWITLSEEGGFVRAAVSDTGIGIKKEDLSRIFDKFYRVKTTETRQIIGTGLGLSIVKSIVDTHLGSISVESEEGRGTTFTVFFPKESNPIIC